MKYTSQHCCDNGRQNGLISRIFFSGLYKTVVNKDTFVCFFLGGGDRRPGSAPATMWTRVLKNEEKIISHLEYARKH